MIKRKIENINKKDAILGTYLLSIIKSLYSEILYTDANKENMKDKIRKILGYFSISIESFLRYNPTVMDANAREPINIFSKKSP